MSLPCFGLLRLAYFTFTKTLVPLEHNYLKIVSPFVHYVCFKYSLETESVRNRLFLLLIQIWEKAWRLFLYQRCLLELTYMMLTNSFCFSSYILWMLLLPKSGYIKIVDMVSAFKELTILKRQLCRYVNK